VAEADGNEIYSWAGASRFDTTDIGTLVRDGPITTGAFAGMLGVVFLRDVETFTFERRYKTDAGDLMEFSFRVPKSLSHYFIRTEGSMMAVDYSGSVSVNAHTADVVQLTLFTGEWPAVAGACNADSTLEFGRVTINDEPFLMATGIRQRFVAPNGGETESYTTLTNCREYSAQSSISFGAAESASGTDGVSSPSARPSIPAGLHFTLELLAPIDTDQAAAGDLVRAKLAGPLRGLKSEILAPAGSIVELRLLRVESLHLPPKGARMVFSPRAVWVKDARVPLAANRDWSQFRQSPRSRAVELLMPGPGEGPAGVFAFEGDHVIVRRGFRSEWRTATPLTGR
jgi:hypothetical protein